jgi:hypothetical protein
MAADRDHSQIVSIHFGMQKFTRIKMYQSIYEDILAKRRAQQRLNKMLENAKESDEKAGASSKRPIVRS